MPARVVTSQQKGQAKLSLASAGRCKPCFVVASTDLRAFVDNYAAVNAVAMLSKTVVSLLPTLVTATMITTATNAAIRPYSIAVTPRLSERSASHVRA